MKNIYRHTERGFEKVASTAISILGNSVTFIIAISLVLIWFCDKRFFNQDIHTSIGEVILGITFITLFVIQKSFNRFSASLHIKLNELVASHEPASNAIINVEERSELELTELSKEYAELAVQAKEIEEEKN